MPRGKKSQSTEVLGGCEYTVGGTDCNEDAVEQINGYALCRHHKKYGHNLLPRDGSLLAQAAEGRENADKIEEHNQGVTERNNGAAAQAAFTPYAVYADLCALTDRVENNMKRVPKGRQIAAYLNSARLLLLDEMSSVAGDVDPLQVPLPLDAASDPEPDVEGDDQ